MNQAALSDSDLSEMLSELRVLLMGAQLFTAFLILLPFSAGFKQIVQSEKWVFLATFLFSVLSLILFTAPAVQHRMVRPLRNRTKFKEMATRQILVGAAALSCALVLGANLVISEVFGHRLGLVVAGLIAVLVAVLWWVLPWSLQKTLSSSTTMHADQEE